MLAQVDHGSLGQLHLDRRDAAQKEDTRVSRPADVPIPRRDEWEIAVRDLPLAQLSRWFVASGRHDNPPTRSPRLARPDHHRRDRGRRKRDNHRRRRSPHSKR